MKMNLALTFLLFAFGQSSYAGKIVHGVFCTRDVNESQIAATVELNSKLNGSAPIELYGDGFVRCHDCNTTSFTPGVAVIRRIDTSKITQISSLVFFREKRKQDGSEVEFFRACITVSGESALRQ